MVKISLTFIWKI